MPDPSASHGSATRATWQEPEPILCKCSAWRYGRMSAHRDWPAEYQRARALGAVPDEYMFAAVELERRERDEASA
jgi:hypothetical protein